MKHQILVFTILLFTALTSDLYTKHSSEAKYLVSKMNLQQKIGQITQPDVGAITQNSKTNYAAVSTYFLGSLLVGGNGCPDDDGNLVEDYTKASMANWQNFAQKLKSNKVLISTPQGDYQVGLLLGTDAVHGNQHVLGEVLFPHNIGLAASHNPSNFFNAGYWTGQSVLKSGFNYIFAPTVAVSHNPQWGRYYETMGSTKENVYWYAQSFVKGAQNVQYSEMGGVMTSTKHFIGDGATFNGNDEGNNQVQNYTSFIENNIYGYRGAISVDTGTVMNSFSAVNSVHMSIHSQMTLDLLKGKEQFTGFVISDYDVINKVAYQFLPSSVLGTNDFNKATCLVINSGIDMHMLPSSQGIIDRFIAAVNFCLDSHLVSMDRIDDSVTRILMVKFAQGLISLKQSSGTAEPPKPKPRFFSDQLSQNAFQDALQAAQESLVLLKNEGQLLPLSPSIQNVILIGERVINVDNGGLVAFQDFDNIGAQNGGWTVRWQGFLGNQFWQGDNKAQSQATSLLDALKTKTQVKNILYPSYTDPTDQTSVQNARTAFLQNLVKNLPNYTPENTIIIGVLAESPYAEMAGDINNLYCYPGSKEGCLYGGNSYLPQQQGNTLLIDFDDYSKQVLNTFQNAKIPLVTVMFSGRPRIIQNILGQSTSFVQAWLPGTTGGQAVTNALFGNYLFRTNSQILTNTLPSDWPADMDTLQNYPIYSANGAMPRIQNRLFDEGYGLKTTLPSHKTDK